MPRLTKITTRRGDDGDTDLADGGRVRKDSLRIHAIGSLDELTSAIGMARAQNPPPRTDGLLQEIQNDLLCLGTALAHRSAEPRKGSGPVFDGQRIRDLERETDALQQQLGPLQNFLRPGGTPAAASLHFARAVCRRAERDVTALSRQGHVASELRIYLNRLSDFLFQAARWENRSAGIPESLWESR